MAVAALSVNAQIMRAEELEEYAETLYGKKWVDIAANLKAESTLTLDKNNSLTYVQIIEAPERTALQLYTTLNYWFTSTFNDATFGVMVAAKNKLFDLWNAFNSINQISSVSWYASDSQFLSTMPVCVSPRLFGIDENTLFSILEASIELESDGQTIRSKMKA